MKVSIFKNSFSELPMESITLEELIERIKNGFWSKIVVSLREKKDSKDYKKIKSQLPAITISGEFKSRTSYIPVGQRLIKHSCYIALDIDKKDNPKIRVKDLVDRECFAQFISCGGEGIKIIYRCTATKDAAEHRRIYDSAVERLQKKGIKINVDPIVKSIASLQYVSYDPEAFYFPKSKLVIKPLPVKKIKVKKPSENVAKDLVELNSYIDSLGDKDVTESYENWLNVAFGLTYSLDEHGRESFHRISKNYKDYNKDVCNDMYDACLERKYNNVVDKPVTIASVFQIINDALPKATVKHLTKKYNKGHAVGTGEDVEGEDQQGDLIGLVRYRLFLFKKVFDKETNILIDLLPYSINLNEFEKLLKDKGFYRFGKLYVQIIGNIVEVVDSGDIMRIVTTHIEGDGDYDFSYKELKFHFSWEELAHLWRTIRGQSTTYNQIASSLTHWQPNLLKDSMIESFIPFQNGVVKVSDKNIKLIPYDQIGMQIWKERILPREFHYTTKKGMYEEFFENVCGRGKNTKERRSSKNYTRALWYYGYMLQGSKRQSTARAWLLYDTRPGNNGRTGKTIIGQAVGKIRSMVIIDGKSIDFKNRFAFQTVQPWTDVVFIDDPSKYMSLQPMFNMITGDMSAEGKGVAPIVKPVKFMIASNWVLEAEGNSEAGRQFVTQIDDFYVRWGKDNGNSIKPIVDYHGKEFFTDWEASDWNEFDSFSMRALQYHLSAKAPENTIIGNALMVRFIQTNESELFFELSNTFIANVKRGKEGGLLVPQQLLTSIIKEHDNKSTPVRAGKLAREYLTCIGATTVEITSIVVSNMNRMAYKIANEYSELNFGEYEKRLPKPNL